MAATILAVCNRKGGVGKTTTAINVGAALARSGYKVLLVDLDPQYNLSRSLRVEASTGNTYDVMQQMRSPRAVRVTDNLDVIPTTKDLAYTEVALAEEADGKQRLAKALAAYRNVYDYILIDTAPALGILTINALVAADYVIAPLQAEFLPLQGLSDLVEIIEQLRQGLNTRLRLLGVVLVRYDSRLLISRKAKADLEAYLKQYGEGKVFSTWVRNNVAVPEAQAFGLDLYRYDEKSKAAQDYQAITNELMQLLKINKDNTSNIYY